MSEETNTLHNGRQRLRPWLVNQINEGNIKGLVWMNAEKNMFKIPWKHAGKQDYDPEEDSKIFKRWSENTGKYKVGVNPEEPAVWKTRLRTALNKLPDIQEVTDKTMLDIPEPYRVYRLLPKTAKQRDGTRATRPISGSENRNNFYEFNGGGYHRQPGYFPAALPYPETNVGNWHHQAAVAPKQYAGQGYYTDERQQGYQSEGYAHGLQQPMARGDLTSVLEVISSGEDSRNMVTSQTMGGHPCFHSNNNDPNQTDQYRAYPSGTFPSTPDYYQTFPATPAPVTNFFPGQYYESQTNQQVPMQTCAGLTESSEVIMNELSSQDCLPAEHEFEVFVYYRHMKVISRQIKSVNGCHIYFNKTNNNHLGSETIVLPSESEVGDMLEKPATLTRSILEASEGGITLQVKDKRIYVTRFCRSALFWSCSLRPEKIERVERYKETAVFNLVEFSECVKNYVCRQSDSPASPAVYFGVAQNWTLNSPLKNCLVSIVVRPMRSMEQLRTMNNQAKSLPLSVHSGLLHFSGASLERESFDYQDLMVEGYPFDPVDMAENVFIQSEGDSPSPP
ncbi:interferon regulatory factor 5-like isoform X3 [Apostichopus japonicus]